MRTLPRIPLRTSSTRTVVALSCAAFALAGCSGPSGPAAAAAAVVTIGAGSCTWSGPAPSPGRQQFTVRNAASGPYLATLGDATTGALWAETGTLAPGTSRQVRTVLPAGTYRWRCVPRQGVSSVSPSRRTAGQGDGTRPGTPIVVLSAEEATNATTGYREAVADGLGHLRADTDALVAAAGSGDQTRTRAAWLTAHLDYERLGAAYGTFGDLDRTIDGLPDGLPGGADDPQFTGFLRVERDLWNGVDGGRLTGDVQVLADAVHRLADGFPGTTTNPGDLPLRAHEILEMAAARELSGRSDQGSGSALATVRAHADGTAMVLDALLRPIQQRDPALWNREQTRLTALTTTLDGLRRPDGSWPGLRELTTAQREALNARMGDLLEQLAPLPDLLEMPPDTTPD
jgi:high-affinity iron transporter